MSNPIDLSTLPPPQSVEEISFENILFSMLTDLRARAPEFSTLSEADPAYKLLEVCAYREVMLRQRENNKTRSLLLAFATGADLDHIGVTYYNGTQRLTVTPANPQAIPPTSAVMESDTEYRRRLLLQPGGESVAGPEQAYVFQAMSAHAEVIDASAWSPWPAGVVVSVMARGAANPSASALQAVADKLSAALILPTHQTAIPAATALTSSTEFTSGGLRPVADRVIIRPATPVPYNIDADITVPTGPDSSVVAKAIAASVAAYKDEPRLLGRKVARSAIYAALHLSGVESVSLNQPATDIDIDTMSAAVCTGIAVRINGQPIAIP
jgi:phage-related baseplate assembly protein